MLEIHTAIETEQWTKHFKQTSTRSNDCSSFYYPFHIDINGIVCMTRDGYLLIFDDTLIVI